MWSFPMIATLPLGMILGFILVLTHRSTKTKGPNAKMLIGILVGFAIYVLLNAVIEIMGLLF